MFNLLKKSVFLLILIILLCSFSEIKADDKKEPKIPFKVTDPIIYTMMLKDKHNNDIEAKIYFQKYEPPLKLNQTFGLEWKDLDFSTVEQIYLGFELCQTKGQYFSIYHGTAKQDMEEIYLEKHPGLFKQNLKERKENQMSKNYSTYYSKCIVEAVGKKYVLTKGTFKFKMKKLLELRYTIM